MGNKEKKRMTKNILYLFIGIVLGGALIFQLFFRYEVVEIGRLDLKYDRLTTKIYIRPMVTSKTPSKEWKEIKLKDFRLAKAWAFGNQVNSFADTFDIETRLDELESNR